MGRNFYAAITATTQKIVRHNEEWKTKTISRLKNNEHINTQTTNTNHPKTDALLTKSNANQL